MIRFEVLITVTFATVVGVLTAAPGAIAVTYGQTGSLVPVIPAGLWLGLPVTAALLGSVAIALPLRGALRASRGSVTAARPSNCRSALCRGAPRCVILRR